MDVVNIHKALGHPRRYRLFLDLLQGGSAADCGQADPEEGACCVVDLTVRHPLAQSTVSHHLRILAEAGLVVQERRGTYSLYRVDTATWKAFRDHLATLEPCCREPGNNMALRITDR